MRLIISSKETLSQAVKYKPDYWAYFHSPHTDVSQLFKTMTGKQKSRFCFHDIDSLQDITDSDKDHCLKAVSEEQICALISDIRVWKKVSRDVNMCLLFSCYAGVSRSAAAGFIALCILFPHIAEERISQYLREKNIYVTPNKAMCSYADVVLKRNGSLLKAAYDIGRGCDAYHAGITFLNCRDFDS